MTPADPAAADAPLSEPQVRQKTVQVFAGGFGVVALVFLLSALSGTNADLFMSNPSTGFFDWVGYARALPPIQPAAVPRVFSDPDLDPMHFDTNPPPRDMLPPEEVAVAPVTPLDPAALEARRREEAAREAAKKLDKRVDEILRRGDQQLKRNRYEKARGIYASAAKLKPTLYPEIARRFYEQGKKQERSRSWSRADKAYQAALRFDSKNAKYHLARAATSDALGDSKQARWHRAKAKQSK